MPGAACRQHLLAEMVRVPAAAGLPYVLCGDGPPAVLVPGLALDRWFWRPLWRPLQGLALHSVDLPRFGSGTVAEVAARLAAWHAAAGLPPCAWVCHSLGGQVGVHLAASRPALVTALVLVAPSVPASFSGYRLTELALDLLHEPGGVWWQIARGVAVRGWADAVRAVAAAREDAGFWDAVGRVRAPCLVVHGERDVFIPGRRLPALARAIPGARRQVIRGARHSIVHTHPAALAAAVAGFLDAAVRRPARAAR